MMIEMPYAAVCLNREVQDRLASALAFWAERLNKRLISLGKSTLTIDRAVRKMIEGAVEISDNMCGAFSAEQLVEGNRLQVPLVLNGIQIEIPLCYDSPATLSLLFIQADGESCDGFAVNPWKPRNEQPEPASDTSDLVRSVTTLLSGLVTDKPKRHKPDWIIAQPCFFPRLHGEWLSRLLCALQCFDPGLRVQESSGGFLPVPQDRVDTVSDFSAAMEALADEYLMHGAEGGDDQ